MTSRYWNISIRFSILITRHIFNLPPDCCCSSFLNTTGPCVKMTLFVLSSCSTSSRVTSLFFLLLPIEHPWLHLCELLDFWFSCWTLKRGLKKHRLLVSGTTYGSLIWCLETQLPSGQRTVDWRSELAEPRPGLLSCVLRRQDRWPLPGHCPTVQLSNFVLRGNPTMDWHPI